MLCLWITQPFFGKRKYFRILFLIHTSKILIFLFHARQEEELEWRGWNSTHVPIVIYWKSGQFVSTLSLSGHHLVQLSFGHFSWKEAAARPPIIIIYFCNFNGQQSRQLSSRSSFSNSSVTYLVEHLSAALCKKSLFQVTWPYPH